MIGTQVAFKTAKMIYVLQPILRIAGGVMYTIMKLQIQLAAVDIDEPFWRALRGKISEGYTYREGGSQHCVSDITLDYDLLPRTQTVAWKPIVKAPWKIKSIAAAPMPAASVGSVSAQLNLRELCLHRIYLRAMLVLFWTW